MGKKYVKMKIIQQQPATTLNETLHERGAPKKCDQKRGDVAAADPLEAQSERKKAEAERAELHAKQEQLQRDQEESGPEGLRFVIPGLRHWMVTCDNMLRNNRVRRVLM